MFLSVEDIKGSQDNKVLNRTYLFYSQDKFLDDI